MSVNFLIWFLLAGRAFGADPVDDAFFEKRIRPVLATHCYGCHSAKLKAPMGGLALDTKAGTKSAITAGKPAESRLLAAMRYPDNGVKMPPSGKLPSAVLADFESWIAAGAPDPRTDAGAAANRGPRKVGEAELKEGRRWWSFQPLRQLDVPATKNSTWPKKKLDYFVLARLDAAGVEPSPAADDRTLLRRVYLDLTGLKPTYEQVEGYAANRAPDKYQRLIEELLASPRYGERWARYWLDVARYAEDNVGNITNPPYPHAWRYRDWVIDALNRDVPYDQFVRLQLAADLMPNAPRRDMAALGYMGLGNIEHKDGRLSAEVLGPLMLNDMDERVDALGRGLLGLSVACARCHDHKFDPIPTRDYYRLKGVFASTQRATRPAFDMEPKDEMRFMWIYQRLFDLHYTANLLSNEPGSKPEQAARQVVKFRAELATLHAEMDELGKRYPAIGPYMATVPFHGENRKNKNAKVKVADVSAPFLNSVYDAGVWIDSSEPDLTLFDYRPGQPRDLPVYRGGNASAPGEIAPRGFPTVLARDAGAFQQGSGRLELAERILTDAAPLSARVIVNRVWSWHFDKGLVATPSDFGTQGERPTHPELLEDLAARFIANGWSLKWLHREILLSAAYCQASSPRAEAIAVDPDNRLLWRMNPRRMDIEAYRDTLLQASGKLDLTAHGPSEELDESARRTVYAKVSRSKLADLLRLYDVQEPVIHVPARGMTISPTQQLFVMNSPFILEQAQALAASLQSEPNATRQVRALYVRIFGREPDAEERDLALSYLNRAGLVQYAQALLATNEAIFWP